MSNEQTAERGFFFSKDDLAKHDREVERRALNEAADEADGLRVSSYAALDGTYNEGVETVGMMLRARAGNEAGQPDKNDGDHGGLVGRDGSRSPSSPHRTGNGDNDE